MNLIRLLEDSARKFSWRRSIISEAGSYSFSSLNKKANQLASGLKEKLGIKKGDKVAVLLHNCPEFIVALFAILKIGAACVPLNIFLTLNELKYILKDCGAKLLISSSDFMQIVQALAQEREKDKTALQNVILTDRKEQGLTFWKEVILEGGIKDSSSAIAPEDLALLIYTSGTTGFPKGVMLSHSNLCANVISSLQALEMSAKDRVLLILPMFHSFTLMVCILIPIYAGARIILVKSLRPFQKVLRSIFLNGVTIIVGIPHLYDVLKNLHLPPILQKLLRIRVCISGAAPLSVETLCLFNQRFKRFSLVEGYGLTEASPVVSLNPLHGMRKAGSIGLPLPGVEVRVVKEDESEAAADEIGELIVKGPNVMRGYLNRPRDTQTTIRSGWLFTGDMAKIDNDGYIYIVGRKKEMIISHGMNIYPQEIENVMQAHPKIKEVAVVGKKDKSKGEVPFAFVALHQDCSASQDEIVNYCKEKLANYKIPRLIAFRQELPKTPTGKVLKRKLIEAIPAD
jgi:long-chain acyl-CoA synthetase